MYTYLSNGRAIPGLSMALTKREKSIFIPQTTTKYAFFPKIINTMSCIGSLIMAPQFHLTFLSPLSGKQRWYAGYISFQVGNTLTFV